MTWGHLLSLEAFFSVLPFARMQLKIIGRGALAKLLSMRDNVHVQNQRFQHVSVTSKCRKDLIYPATFWWCSPCRVHIWSVYDLLHCCIMCEQHMSACNLWVGCKLEEVKATWCTSHDLQHAPQVWPLRCRLFLCHTGAKHPKLHPVLCQVLFESLYTKKPNMALAEFSSEHKRPAVSGSIHLSTKSLAGKYSNYITSFPSSAGNSRHGRQKQIKSRQETGAIEKWRKLIQLQSCCAFV